MKIKVVALAGALLALTAAAAQASPATVVPDTLHKLGSGAKQVVNGTAKGVGDQYHHAVAAGRRTFRDARHGRLFHHHHGRHHHMWSHHHMSSHHHHAMSQGGADASAMSAGAGGDAAMQSHTHTMVKTTDKTSGSNPPAAPQG